MAASPVVRRLKGRGTNGVVVVDGRALFAPGGSVRAWSRRLSKAVERHVEAEAPTNKRPRWGHYGKPLKSTIKSSTNSDPVNMMVHSGVGSAAPYSYYVDQGTGIYGGNGPYEAKILPPWKRGGASLYEHTWRPPGSRRAVGTVTVKGQPGQEFFEKGLRLGFIEMRLAEGASPMQAVRAAVSRTDGALPDFLGSTPWSFAFDAQLREWRSWRDTAWNAGRTLGKNGGGAREGRRQRATADRQTQRRTRKAQPIAAPVKPVRKPRVVVQGPSAAEVERAKRLVMTEKMRRKEERERNAEEQERKDIQKRIALNRTKAIELARKQARAAAAQLKGQYPDAQVLQSVNDDGTLSGFWVKYTMADGTVQWTKFDA